MIKDTAHEDDKAYASALEAVLKVLLTDVEAMQAKDNPDWFEGFEVYEYDFEEDDISSYETVSVEWPNLRISAENAKKTLRPEIQVEEPIELHWHEYNPWKEKAVYVTFSDIMTICNYNPPLNGFNALDCYLLPQPDPELFYAGIRYGKEPSEYLSLHINQFAARDLYLRRVKQPLNTSRQTRAAEGA